MLESDFWKDLATKFRALNDPMGILYAEWTSFHEPHWQLIRGDFVTLAAQYEPLARRGGKQLDPSRDSLEVWLDSMRAEPNFVYDEITKVETGEVLSCSIRALCQRSADFCNILESRAIEKERIAENEERERSDPRNWSPLRQQWEAHKSIKKLQSGSHEQIRESFVRDVLARQYGVKPEEVTFEQIRHEVTRLFKAYPAITLVQDSTSAPIKTETETPTEVNRDDCKTRRRAQIEDFLRKCNAHSRRRIYKRHLWRSVGHSRPRQFEYWQECSEKATDEDRRNFERVVATDPQEFVALLGRLKLIDVE